VETTVPVAPLELPVIVSPIVKEPPGIVVVKVVDVGTALTSVTTPLVPPVISSLAVNVPVTLFTVIVNVLADKLVGLK